MNTNMRRQRMPREQEAELKAYRRSVIMALLDMDTLYTRKGEWLSQNSVARMLDITTVAAAHCLGRLETDGFLLSTQRPTKTHNGVENLYKRKPPSILTIPWRKHSNAFTGSSHYQRLGVPI
jgi:hypothetical protein